MLWNTVKESLHNLLPESEYGLWIQPLTCQQENDTTLEIGCPDRFFQAWIKERYLGLIESSLQQLHDVTPTVKLSVANQLAQPENGRTGQLRLPGVSTGRSSIRSLHPAYTFDQFMVGESNMLARSACGAIATDDPTFGNSLFINSDTGLGKSHLTQGVVHHVMATSPATRMQYLTAQQFSAEMVKGIRTGSMEQFSKKFINGCDLLLVEDVHTLTGKTKTQEELNNILDYLIKSGKRVILTSAVPPRQLKGLDEDFRSRMTSGLVTGIDAPDYDTCAAIVSHKASVNDLTFSDEIIDYMARHLRGDVRRLESAIIGIKAKSCLRRQQPDIEMVKEILSDIVDNPTILNGETIRDFIGCQFDISVNDLCSRSRKRAISYPRQIAMYLTRKYTDESLADIGSHYNRDHSTVLHAIKVITRDLAGKTSAREQMDLLIKKLKL